MARCIYDRANQALRSANQKEERVLLLEAWREFETKYGDETTQDKLLDKMPKRVKKRQRVLAADGVRFLVKYINYIKSLCYLNCCNVKFFFQSEEGWEEFFDYIFPEDETAKPNLKLLANAKAWKQKMQELQEEN